MATQGTPVFGIVVGEKETHVIVVLDTEVDEDSEKMSVEITTAAVNTEPEGLKHIGELYDALDLAGYAMFVRCGDTFRVCTAPPKSGESMVS